MRGTHFLLISIVGIASLFLLSSLITAQLPGSCKVGSKTYCGSQSPQGCYCDTKAYNDYCNDIDSVCGTSISDVPTPKPLESSCQGYCGGQSASGCWCDTKCTSIGDCCSDYQNVCKGGTPIIKEENKYNPLFKIDVITWGQTGKFTLNDIIVPTYRFKVVDVNESHAKLWAMPAYGDFLIPANSTVITPVFKTFKINETGNFTSGPGAIIKITLLSITKK